MKKHRIAFAPAAQRQFRKLPKDIQKRVARAIDRLEQTPFPDGVKKLAGEENLFRLRVGDYRVLYQVRNKELLILIVRVRHRKEVYE